MTLTTHKLTLDTQAILLLCGRFGRRAQDDPKPLSNGEYNRLVQALAQSEERPKDLLDQFKEGLFSGPVEMAVERSRLISLLKRAAELSFFVEQFTNNGGWIVSRADTNYPPRLKTGLREKAPPLLYGFGPLDNALSDMIGVVGSRNADGKTIEFASSIGRSCAEHMIGVVSGGAKGVDSEAMYSCLRNGGIAVGVLADGLLKKGRSSTQRDLIIDGRLSLISPYIPSAGFSVGNAMARNKLIYALSQATVIVESDKEKGGTWGGAKENKRFNWVSGFVREDEPVSPGRKALLELGYSGLKSEGIEELVSRFSATRLGPEKVVAAEPDEPYVVSERGNSVVTQADETEVALATEFNDLDVFDYVWPAIKLLLSSPREERYLLAKMNVRQGQLRDWLNEAVKRNLVVKTGRPNRYTLL